MSLLDLMTHFDAAHGKYSRTDKVYTRVRKFDNRTIGVALKHPVRSAVGESGGGAGQVQVGASQGEYGYGRPGAACCLYSEVEVAA